MRRIAIFALAVALIAVVPATNPQARQSTPGTAVILVPTNHPRLPPELSQLWMASDPGPGGRTAAPNGLAIAVQLEVEGDHAKALTMLAQPALHQGPLGQYAEFYQAFAELGLGRPADALRRFQTIQAHEPIGYLVEGAALREAECYEALGDQAAALAVYERLSTMKTTTPEGVLLRVGRAAKAVGDFDKAQAAFLRAYYEFPFSDLSSMAATELENNRPLVAGTTLYKLELGRAERLFGGKKYAQARSAFERLRSAARGDDRELVELRLAESDYYLKRPRAARDGVREYIERASRQAEALFFYAISIRELGQYDEYLRTVRRIVTEFPTQSWAEEALNNLATHYIRQDDDEQADETFRELYGKFPAGRYAERAAWKIGWSAYKSQRFAETVSVFERAAGDFPRSDYRPQWLYWSGRARDALHEPALAEARYTLAATDYLNSYYGRLAVGRLVDRGLRVPQRRLMVETRSAWQRAALPEEEMPLVTLPPNEQVVRALLALELYDQAADELQYAQNVWGDSPAIQATLAWIAHKRGDLRIGINTMKRAYPQYLAAGGEQLPSDLLRVLFPMNYWSMIRRYSLEHRLDPYLMAALIAQESTFTADIKSPANAYGLMQLLPSTGRRYAKKLRLTRRFSIGLLTTAEPNIRMGTAYFADLIKQFGGAHFALASYNAGERRVVRWIAERPEMDREEFIDDIPFPETQNYVKRVLGTAEDYRRLYGPASAASEDEILDVAAEVPTVASPKPPKANAAKKPAATKKKNKGRVPTRRPSRRAR